MATFACVSLPPQFITPPPSTSNCNQHNDSDSGSSSGASGGEMKSHEVSDDGGSTSSQQTPPEYPSPPPPSNSPPESMASLQAESPIGDEDTPNDVGGFSRSADGTSSEAESGAASPEEVWMVQPGYHAVPIEGPIPSNRQANVFMHAMEGIDLAFQYPNAGNIIGHLQGPGTVRMLGDPEMLYQPLPIQVPYDHQAHQFYDENGKVQHVVMSVTPNSSGQNSQELNGRKIVTGNQLMNSMGIHPQNGNGSYRGGRGHHSNGNRRGGNYGNSNGNGNQRNGQGNYDQGNRNGYSRGNYRGNRGRGRGDYHGRPRGQQDNHVANNVQELPELAVNTNAPVDRNTPQQVDPIAQPQMDPNVHNQMNSNFQRQINPTSHSQMNPNFQHQMNPNNQQPMEPNAQNMVNVQGNVAVNGMLQPMPAMVPAGQMSLLGEPSGEPMADMTAAVSGPPAFAPLSQPSAFPPPPGIPTMMAPPPDVPMQDISMNVAPAMMNGGMHPAMVQDPMMPGTSMGMVPQMYGVPPPPPGMVMVPAESAFNNNKWIPYQTLEENEVLRGILGKLRFPALVNVLTTEMEFLWYPIHVNDCRFKNGVNMFDISIIKYHASILDSSGTLTSNHVLEDKTDGIGSNLLRLTNLRPNTDYKLVMKAVIAERGIEGTYTADVWFRTAPGRPDPPTGVELTGRGLHFISLAWKPANNNGIFVSLYHVYIYENELENGRMLQTSEEKIEIPNLMPQTCYKITINAINALGESLTGTHFNAWTKANRPPRAPENISVVPQSHRSIRVSWDSDPNSYIWIELYHCASKDGGYVREQFVGNSTVLGELEQDTEYQIRVIARNEFGDGYSNWMNARTQKFRKFDNARNRNYSDENRKQVANNERPPSMPYFVRFVDNCPEMAWRTYGAAQQEHNVIIEGSTFETPDKYVQLYRGNAFSLIVVDHSMHYMRVITLYKKGHRSPPSERAVIPREYAKNRPERVTKVKVSLTNEGTVLVQWKKLNPENMKIPEIAKVLYYVQRCDLVENPVLSAGEEDHCTFENIPGETNITVQVRAAVSFHDVLTHGDWSSPVHFTTPRGLPAPAINVKFDSKTSTLSWDCLDQSQDLQFTVKILQLPSKRNILKMTTKSRNLVLDSVQPGEKYGAAIISFTDVGQAPKQTALEFNVPALKPSTPADVVLSHIQTDGCTVSWKASEPNGSRIIGYNVRMMLNGELYRENFVTAIENEVNYRLPLKNLNSNTNYVITVAAKNTIGFSERIEHPVRTQPLAPNVPQIWCDCESNSLRIQWDHVTTSSDIIYKIMRINPRGQQMSLYEGENNQMKVKNLQENTEYLFKMRVSDRMTGACTWSDQFSFSTTTAPPPPVKLNPTSVLVPGHSFLYRIEWKDCLPENSPHQQFYRLQIVDATVQGAKWQMVYEGKTPRFDLNTEEFAGGLHVRVLCVREQEEGELKGSPSPVAYIANIPPEVEPAVVEQNTTKSTIYRFFRRTISPASLTVPLLFVCVVLFMMSFSETMYTWVTGGVPNSTSTQNPTGPPAPPSSQPPR